MRPGRVRRGTWAALSALLASTAPLVVATASPAEAVAVSETYSRPASGAFQLNGHGWGHGRGMSQYGARGAATLGKTADQITATYYPSTTKVVQGNPTMRVWLSSDTRSSTREFLPAYGQMMRDTSTGKKISLPVPSSASPGPSSALLWRITKTSAGFRVAYVRSGTTTTLSTAYTGPLEVREDPGVSGTVAFVRVRFSNGTSRDYRNLVRVLSTGSTSLMSIAVMPMESYLRGVVPRESPSSWEMEALKAQAIAARSYSTYKRDHVSSTQKYDICDTTQCQVFMGSNKYKADGTKEFALEATRTNEAIAATAGVIRAYQGKAIFSEFSASNGGWSTEGNFPYLVAKADPWDGVTGSSVHSWDATLPVSALERYFAGRGLGSFRSMTITERDGNGEWGGRVLSVVLRGVDGSGNPTSVTTTGSGIFYAHQWPAVSNGLRGRWFRIVPSYSSSLVSRTTAPTLVLPPGNPKAVVTAVVRNSGTSYWPVSGLHLALASPAGGKDPLVGGSTRPGAYVKNLTEPGASTVDPGDQVQFRVPFDATGLSPGTRTAAYRVRIGTASLFGATISWTVVVQDPRFTAAVGAPPSLVQSSYAPTGEQPPALWADGRTVLVPRDGSTTVRLTSKNTGNLTWPVGGSTPLVLGTAGPRDRSSASATSSWISSARPARLSAPAAVAPGSTGTFDLQLGGNGVAAGVTRESFDPAWEGESWIAGSTTTLTVVRIDRAVSRAAAVHAAPAAVTLVNAPTGRANLLLRLRNVGSQPWKVGEERLKASSTPLRYHWLATDNPATLHRNYGRPGLTVVHPGEVGEWVIPVTGANAKPGSYSFTVRPATSAGSAYGPAVTVRATVVAANFSATLTLVRSSVDVPRNGRAGTYFYVKNTGNVNWPVGGALRSKVLSTSSPSYWSGWLSKTRPASLSANATAPGQMLVKPGQVARFAFVLSGNGRAPGKRTEKFGISWDGWRSNPLSVTVAYRVV